jgi:hypothetical protein
MRQYTTWCAPCYGSKVILYPHCHARLAASVSFLAEESSNFIHPTYYGEYVMTDLYGMLESDSLVIEKYDPLFEWEMLS